MDRVPASSIRVPLGRHIREGQQKRPYHRRLLAQEGVRRPSARQRDHRPLGAPFDDSENHGEVLQN